MQFLSRPFQALLKQSIAPLLPGQPLRTSRIAMLWLGLSLAFAAYYGLLGLHNAFRPGYVVQDDARSYVFWMQRWLDPALFPGDLIADYFQSIAPPGYAALYHFMAVLGIEPLLFSKLLPIALGIIASFYCFRLCLEIFPVPLAGFIATLLLNQSCWFKDDLASGAPRGFVYPLFLAFLYYLLRSSWCWVCLVNVLQGLIYPPLIFISTALLAWRLPLWETAKQAFDWRRKRPRLKRNHGQQTGYRLLAIGLGVVSLLPYAIASSQFGPVVTGAEARLMPELWEGGRHPFFNTNPWWFWLVGQHSGILPAFLPPLIWLGLLLPFLLRHPARFPLVKQVQPQIAVLSQTIGVSYGLFFAAHALLLKLFFPTRYTQHSLRIVMALAAGIGITVLLDAALRRRADLAQASLRQTGSSDPQARSLLKQGGLWTAIGLFSLALLISPSFFEHFPKTNYRITGDGSLYEFLQEQPPDSLIASLGTQADYIPTFAHRPVLVAREYALPFHRGYYDQIRQRTAALIEAQYSQDLGRSQELIRRYGIRFWLLNRDSFQPDYLKTDQRIWLKSFQPAYDQALASLAQGRPALASLTRRCAVFRQEDAIVLSADCILNPRSPSKRAGDSP